MLQAEPGAVQLNLPTPRLPDNESDTDEGFLSTSKEDSTLLECLNNVDYWLLCGSVSLTTGTGLAFINSASAITHSLHGSSSLTVRPLLVPVSKHAWGLTRVSNCHSHCLLYTSPSPRDRQKSRMPSSA